MACPYFEPRASVMDSRWGTPARLPLGDAHVGVCRSPLNGPREMDNFDLRGFDLCNMGYARGRCRSFPEDAAADAVRFSVSHDDARLVRIQFIMEREHTPLEHGVLEYAIESGTFPGGGPETLVHRQARMFAESYLRRKAIA
ncbi:MAG: hypothetical protein ABI165_19010 [Bryobacteraceae bacterium]